MSIAALLKIVARKKPVVTLAVGLAIVSVVSTAILQSGGIIESASTLASKLVKPREKLVQTSNLCTECVRQCHVILKTGNKTVSTVMTVIPESIRVKGLPSKTGWTGVGYLLSRDLGISKGANITIEYKDETINLTLLGVYRTGSPLDTGITVIGDEYTWCSEAYYTLQEESPFPYSRAFSEQVGSLVHNWGPRNVIGARGGVPCCID